MTDIDVDALRHTPSPDGQEFVTIPFYGHTRAEKATALGKIAMPDPERSRIERYNTSFLPHIALSRLVDRALQLPTVVQIAEPRPSGTTFVFTPAADGPPIGFIR